METQTTPVYTAVNTEIALQRLNGNEALLASLTSFFLEDAPQLLEHLHEGLRTDSLPQVVISAHSLRGLASTFEAIPVMQLAAEIESLGRKGDCTRLKELAGQLDAEFVRLMVALRAINSSPTVHQPK